MSSKSNDQGRAYEYRCLLTLQDRIAQYQAVTVEQNSSFDAAKKAWDRMDAYMQATLTTSAAAATNTIFALEPLLKEPDADAVELKLQKDSQGETGDVRDIVISRQAKHWEIGLSVKHNHFAVKHSRLGKDLDFGARWFGIPCSDVYWNEIRPIFDYLTVEKERGTAWKELPNKEDDVYVPLLLAFRNEVRRSDVLDKDMPRKLVEYLLGQFDFYKIISLDKRKLTQIQTYNLHGDLNRVGKTETPQFRVPLVNLPTRIVHFDFKPGSKNTLELYMDGGWQFSFRIHNAVTKVETSLKFDVQMIGVPATIITIESAWEA